MKTSTLTLMMLVTLMSSMFVISATNWINMWMCMEVNMMAFIPLMYKNKNTKSSKSVMIYFLIQSMASIIMIISILLTKKLSSEKISMLLLMSMMMKLGLPPFHQWFPEIMNMMEWHMCLMLSTWQKMAPLFIMSQIMEKTKLMMIIISASAIMGAIGGVNQTSTRKMISYSSISHLSWMTILLMMNKKLWMIYLLTYSIIMMMLCFTMKKNNILFMNQMKTFSLSMTEKMSLTMMMMSLGGLPPFMGFFPKWMVIQELIAIQEILIMLIMLISSLIILSYYLRMTNSMNMIYFTSQKWSLTTKTQTSTTIMMINIMTLLIMLMFNF